MRTETSLYLPWIGRRARAWAMLPIVAVIGTACADPVGSIPAPSRLPNAAEIPVGDASQPEVVHFVDAAGHNICASWADPTSLAGGTKLSFGFYQLSTIDPNDNVLLEIVSLKGKETLACITRPLFAHTQTVRVVGEARKGGGPNASLTYTQPADVVIVVE